MNILQLFFTKLWQNLRGQPLQTQLSLAAAVVLVVAAFVMLFAWSSQVSYVPLLTQLSSEDAAKIVEDLETNHVPYRIESGGSAILVPADMVVAQRLRLAGSGLPKGGGVGFEIFNEPILGISRFNEEINYNRALEGELRRTIIGLDAVRDARVHVVVPKPALFSDEPVYSSAAVTIQRHAGRMLSSAQVDAIIHLVSAAVPNLTPDHITVIDTVQGILAKEGEGAALPNSALNRQRAIEKLLEERVSQLLAPIVGANHFVVRSTVNLDFSQREKTSESFDPQATAVRSEQFSNEQRTGSSAEMAAGGISGVRSNTAIGNGNASSGSPPTSNRRLETRNYEINKVIQKEIGQSGVISRLSVAVLLDGTTQKAADGNVMVTERSPAELERITELVRKAVGFDADRDDQVVVQSMLFEPGAAEAAFGALTSESTNHWLRQWLSYWPPVLLSMVIVGITIAVLRRPAIPVDVKLLEVPSRVADLEAALQKQPTSPNALAAGQGVQADPSTLTSAGKPLLPVKSSGKPLNEQTIEPQRAANVLRVWLSQE